MVLTLLLTACGGDGGAGATSVVENEPTGSNSTTVSQLSGRFEVVSKECGSVTTLPPLSGTTTPAMITLTQTYTPVDIDGVLSDSNAAYVSTYTVQCPGSVPINQGYVTYTTSTLNYYQTAPVVTTYSNCEVTYATSSNPSVPSWSFPYTIAQDGGIVLTSNGCTFTYKKDY